MTKVEMIKQMIPERLQTEDNMKNLMKNPLERVKNVYKVFAATSALQPQDGTKKLFWYSVLIKW